VEGFKALVRLIRPRHTGHVVGIVAVLSIVSHGFSTQSLFAIVSALFLSIAIFFLDDAYDCRSDRIVHPGRPVPKGLISVRTAYLAGVILMFAGILFASMLLIHQFAIFIALTIIAIGIVFLNLGSVSRAFLTGFVIWGLFPFSAFPDTKIMLFGLIVFLPHVGGSIAKDFLHSSGDREQGLEPPHAWSRFVASLAFFLSCIVIWLPFLLGFASWLYLLPILITMVICVVLGLDVLKGKYQRVYALGRIGMISALLAFVVGQL